jgi:hypothetical protein
LRRFLLICEVESLGLYNEHSVLKLDHAIWNLVAVSEVTLPSRPVTDSNDFVRAYNALLPDFLRVCPESSCGIA